MFVDKKTKTAYLYLDSVVTTETMAERVQTSDTDTIQDQLKDERLTTMRGLLIMLLMSHLVISILPPSVLPAEFLSTLAALNQVKQGIYTHLSQLQSACWKCWDINVPNALFERKEGEYRRERERFYPNLMGWWGPAKGVPMMVFVAAESPIPNIDTTPRAGLPMAIKRHQETLQVKVKTIFRSMHLIPAAPENNNIHPPVEVRSLFALPATQSFIHIVPAIPSPERVPESDNFSFDQPTDLCEWLEKSAVLNEEKIQEKSKDNKVTQSSQAMLEECGDRLLRNFVSHWIKASTTRHPMHAQTSHGSRKSHDGKSNHVPLPTALQFASALMPLRTLAYNLSPGQDGQDFKKAVIGQSPGAKGMIQQIEVILRKKTRDVVDIETMFSKRRVLAQWK
ncbi:hypothetical protein CLU79DRAFT_770402 [Phycomyces nitens]|nr:hypothetical protein CLU79DRAFT_770402 [Phycomyces nitens]